MTDEPTPQAGRVELPVWELVKGSYGELFAHSRGILHLAALPLAVNLLIQFRTTFAAVEDMQNIAKQGDGALVYSNMDGWLFLYSVLGWLVLSAVLASWLRMVLLKEAPPKPLGIAFHRREFRLFGYMLAVLFAWALVYFAGIAVAMIPLLIGGALGDSLIGRVFVFIGIIVMVVGAVFSLIAVIRWSFVLPAVALDASGGLRHRFKAAWNLAKGNTGRLALALLLASLPIVVLTAVVFIPLFLAILESAAIGMAFVLLIIVSTLSGLISYLVYGAIYAHAFRHLTHVDVMA